MGQTSACSFLRHSAFFAACPKAGKVPVDSKEATCQRVSTSPSFSDVSQQLQSPSSPASDTTLQCGHPGVEPKLRCMRYVHPHQNPVPETSAHMHRRETETIAVLVDKLLCCYGTPKAQGPIKQVVKCLARLDGNRSLG